MVGATLLELGDVIGVVGEVAVFKVGVVPVASGGELEFFVGLKIGNAAEHILVLRVGWHENAVHNFPAAGSGFAYYFQMRDSRSVESNCKHNKRRCN